MSTGAEVTFQRRFGGHDGNTEWDYFTTIPDLTKFFYLWLRDHGPSPMIKGIHSHNDHSVSFHLPQGIPHHIAGRLVGAWAAEDMDAFSFIIRLGESYLQQIRRP